MSDARPQTTSAPRSLPPSPQSELLVWIREHWVALAVAAVLLLLISWFRSGKPPTENGRFVLVKDDVPCQSATEAEARRWCYVVLDTRNGKLEERVRRFGSRSRH